MSPMSPSLAIIVQSVCMYRPLVPFRRCTCASESPSPGTAITAPKHPHEAP
jgi:hypothetical protein